MIVVFTGIVFNQFKNGWKVRFENLTVEDVKSKLDKFDDPYRFSTTKIHRFSLEKTKYLIVRDNGREEQQKKKEMFALLMLPLTQEDGT